MDLDTNAHAHKEKKRTDRLVYLFTSKSDRKDIKQRRLWQFFWPYAFHLEGWQWANRSSRRCIAGGVFLQLDTAGVMSLWRAVMTMRPYDRCECEWPGFNHSSQLLHSFLLINLDKIFLQNFSFSWVIQFQLHGNNNFHMFIIRQYIYI